MVTTWSKENGELCSRLIDIQVTYLKGWFLVDFASCFPFDQVVTMAEGGGQNDQDLRSLRIIRVVRLTRLLKLARLFKISRVLASIEEQLRIPHSLIKLLKLFGNVVIFMH